MSKEPKRNVYVGHRYVPLIMDEWDKTMTYEGLSVVTHEGGSYTSKKRVPVGIDINNNEYWSMTGNYNAQVENYRQDVINMEDRVNGKIDDVNETMENKADKNSVGFDVTDFGADPSGNTSSVNAIKQAIQINNKIVYPEGRYLIDDFLLIEDRGDITFEAVGKVEFYDTGKQVRVESGSTGITSYTVNGMKFTNNSSITFIGDFTYTDNRSELTWPEPVNPLDADKIVPAMDFHNNGYVDFNVKMGGMGLPVYAGDNSDPNTGGAHEIMASSYFRFWRNKTVQCHKSTILSGAGKGEVYGFSENDNVFFENCSHFQGNSPVKFFSFGKFINNKNVRIKGIRVQSESTGSFIDVAGGNIIYEDVVLDYPLGKFIDVTNEWGYNNVTTDNILIKDSFTNSDGVIFTATSQNINLKPVKKMVVDNVNQTNPSGALSGSFIETHFIEDTTIKNLTIENYPYANIMNKASSDITPNKQNVTFDNVNFISSMINNNGAMFIECNRGNTIIKNSYINMNFHNYLGLRDRFGMIDNDLSNSKNKIIIKDSIIENTEIRFQSNVDFINCEFKNVVFYPFSSGGSYSNVEINFYGGKYEIDNINFNTGNSEFSLSNIFKFQQSVSPVKKLSLNNILFKGRTTGNVFNSNSVTRCELIEMVDTNFNIDKVNGDGVIQPSYNLNILGSYNNHDDNATIIINKSKLKGRVLTFYGDSDSSNDNIVKTFKSVYSSERGLNDFYTSFHIQSEAIMDGTTFLTIDNVYAYNEDSYYSSYGSTFKELLKEGNIEGVNLF